ncbi:uncharacterized protein B0I36DRAFT_362494 [Microdochium trichocladiopsis]|uniref:Uncharacterized protein n=1 Tax=Microdochium trichocladiopsis TaxID=1682393 RepID=A0A9P9BQB1_9PEZI|nr:uncharacterized protein B0I36DRAFT_362494 [Microdochium trichocladiopsis]KAH7030663.1 hypothetical protein B0I36DRAFT_362494 [Microdochium trichocladiopsis]
MDRQPRQEQPLLTETRESALWGYEEIFDAFPLQPQPQQTEAWNDTDGAVFGSHITNYDASPPAPAVSESKRGSVPALLWDVLKWWQIEIFACLASVAAIVAQAVVMLRFNGRPQESWPSTTLTLNGLIAILATLCRGSLMVPVASVLAQSKWTRFDSRSRRAHKLAEWELLDEASRGSLGSLQVLWKFKGVLHVSCIGAVITIASLALSTFSQQVVSLQSILVPATDGDTLNKTASVPWTDSPNVRVWSAGEFGSMSTVVKLAIIEGIMAPDVASLPLSCPTGNCTWPDFTTVGACGRCVNITEDVRFTQSTLSETYTLPNGLWVGRNPVATTAANETLGFSANITQTTRLFDPVRSPNPKYERALALAEFAMLGFENLRWQGGPPVAFECGIWLCLQARRVSVTAGQQTDKVIESWTKVDVRIGTPFIDMPSPPFVGHEDMYFWATREPSVSLESFIQPMLNGNITLSGTPPSPVFSSDYIQALSANLGDPSQWIGRLAESTTNGLRQMGPYKNTTLAYDGEAHVVQVIVVARWHWLAYPAVLVLLTVIYLVFEITRTTTSNTRPWKADPLVPLYAYLDLDRNVLSAARDGLNKPSGLSAELGDLAVRLDVGYDHGVRFSGRIAVDGEVAQGRS